MTFREACSSLLATAAMGHLPGLLTNIHYGLLKQYWVPGDSRSYARSWSIRRHQFRNQHVSEEPFCCSVVFNTAITQKEVDLLTPGRILVTIWALPIKGMDSIRVSLPVGLLPEDLSIFREPEFGDV